MLLLPTLSERTQEIMSFCFDAPPVMICLLKRWADFTYILDTRGVCRREKLLTQMPPCQKNILRLRESGS